MSASIRHRLDLLSRQVAAAPREYDPARTSAVRRLFDALEAALPGDQCGSVPASEHRGTYAKAEVLAQRIQSASTTPQDIVVLESLPREALAVFPMTAEQFVLMVVGVRDLY